VNNSVTATDAGNSLVLASGRNFINNYGAAALDAGAGRWLVYSADPLANTKNGLSEDFKLYNKTIGGYAPGSVTESDNGFLYRTAPTLTITADDATKVSGNANPSLAYTITGYIDSDTVASALTGAPALTTTAITSSPVGTYTITAAGGTLASPLGYQFSYMPGTLTVTAAPQPSPEPISPSQVEISRQIVIPPSWEKVAYTGGGIMTQLGKTLAMTSDSNRFSISSSVSSAKAPEDKQETLSLQNTEAASSTTVGISDLRLTFSDNLVQDLELSEENIKKFMGPATDFK
jgi:hypothetical protein